MVDSGPNLSEPFEPTNASSSGQNSSLSIDHSSTNTESLSDEFDMFSNILDEEITNYIKELEKERKLCKFDELIHAVKFCKDKLRESFETSHESVSRPKMQKILAKMIECSLEVDRLKEEEENPVVREKRNRLIFEKSHRFALQSAKGRNPYCEICMNTIWRILQRYRLCEDCGFRAHEKCITRIQRSCPCSSIAKPSFRFLVDICNESGLPAQNYKCFECERSIKFGGAACEEPRLCDYTGKLYCIRCHWNDEYIIPSRIIHNWDFRKYKVCRATKQLLTTAYRRPIINFADANPNLLKFVDKLQCINVIRQKILLIKCYFVCCKSARKRRLLQYLKHRQHFVENADFYSLSDLQDLQDDVLIPEMNQILNIFSNHVTNECKVCQGNGFYCELCSANEVIYPFLDKVSVCLKCYAAFHKDCYDRKSKRCPRCIRRMKRRSQTLNDVELVK